MAARKLLKGLTCVGGERERGGLFRWRGRRQSILNIRTQFCGSAGNQEVVNRVAVLRGSC